MSSLSTISVQWLSSDGLKVAGDGFTMTGSEGPSTDAVITSSLTFNSLLTSHAGEYTCRTSLTISGTEVVNHTVDVTFTVRVKCKS